MVPLDSGSRDWTDEGYKKKRIKVKKTSLIFTVISAIAMGLVVAQHLPSLPSNALLDLGVPWFFFASGFWMSRHIERAQDWQDQIRRRVKSLIVPYFLWNLIWFPILFTCNWIGWKYFNIHLVIDGSIPCFLRCLGFSPYAWPALVPTWFLRSVFVAAVVVGGFWVLLRGRSGRIFTAVALWGIYFLRLKLGPFGSMWDGFFKFGLPLLGCSCFALGGALEIMFCRDRICVDNVPLWVKFIRRQMMPVFFLHVIVIVPCGWIAKAFGRFDLLRNIYGDIIMWFFGILGAILIGEVMRKYVPKTTGILFGGR